MAGRTRDAPGDRWTEHVVSAEESGRPVQEILTRSMGVSRRMIQRLTRSGGIRVNGRAPFLGRKLREGEVVRVRTAEREEASLAPIEMELRIVHEDESVLVIDKPPFLLVHPTGPEQRETLAHGIAHHLAARGLRSKVRPVHRLDRDTSGLVLFAGSATAHAELDRQLRAGEVERRYLALVRGTIEEDERWIDAPIGRDPRRPALRAVRPGGDEARTRIRVRGRFADATLLEVELETGRTHQIRVHLAHLGHPVLGDTQYGGPRIPGLRRQALHASSLAFGHPQTAERLTFEAPLPDDLRALESRLRT